MLGPMNASAPLFESASVVIERFSHLPGLPHRDPDAEVTGQVAVSFVESGRFSLRQDKDWFTFEPSNVLVSVPGLVRQYRHLEECPDDVCLSVAFAPEAIEDAVGDTRTLLPHPRVAAGPAADFAHALMVSALASREPLWIEEAAFHATLAFSDAWRERRLRAPHAAAHTRAVRRSMEFMAAGAAGPCSLSTVAREIGMSPFHFARLFSELAGTSPHQFLLALRLRRSAAMLRSGASVTDAAMSSGFENLSHFSRSFRRRFGVNPRTYASSHR
jgi:AraC-like DNA-binding protein